MRVLIDGSRPVQKLKIVKIDGRGFIISLANQLAMADLAGQGSTLLRRSHFFPANGVCHESAGQGSIGR